VLAARWIVVGSSDAQADLEPVFSPSPVVAGDAVLPGYGPVRPDLILNVSQRIFTTGAFLKLPGMEIFEVRAAFDEPNSVSQGELAG
jgi:hypothetical protein